MKNKLAVALCLITVISKSQIINTIAGGGALLSNISATQAVLVVTVDQQQLPLLMALQALLEIKLVILIFQIRVKTGSKR
jgi:hypothetical protein